VARLVDEKGDAALCLPRGKFFGGAAIKKHLFPPSLVPAARVIGHGKAKYSQHAALVA
jgi:hypothetical protein